MIGNCRWLSEFTFGNSEYCIYKDRYPCDIRISVLPCNCGSYCVIGTCRWLSEFTFGNCEYCIYVSAFCESGKI